MSLSGQLLADFALYGLPVLFGVVLAGSAGLPIPGVVVVIAAGALVQEGELNLWWAIGVACVAAILGDCLGYAIGRYGGRRLAARVTRRLGGESYLRHAEATAARWGGLGIFVSRWLLTPIGSTLNLASGLADYPFARFLLFDVPGEIVWSVEYVLLGELLSNRVGALVELLGQLAWVIIGLIAAAFFGWNLYRYLRRPRQARGANAGQGSEQEPQYLAESDPPDEVKDEPNHRQHRTH